MKLKLMIALLGLGISGAPAFAAQPAHPGTVNYVEGAAYLEGRPLNNKDVGNAMLEAGQELSTAEGKAEILLTPGVFLRMDANSTVKMLSPDLALTKVELEKGRAGIEVDEIHDQNNLQVVDAGVTTRLDKKGYYEFDANQPQALVFKGMAKTEVADGKWREIKSHHELMLTGGSNGQSLLKEKPADFDTHASDELYNWSNLRSQYLAEANNQIAGEYASAGYYPGWYWNPYGWGYTFVGGGPFYSPFGYGFYPFGWGGFYPGLYGGWGGGWGSGPYGGHVGHAPYRYGTYHRGFAQGGVTRGGAGHTGIAGGGFHSSGMSGFHGGMGGGFHGGFGGRR